MRSSPGSFSNAGSGIRADYVAKEPAMKPPLDGFRLDVVSTRTRKAKRSK
jgi:hypothetical protein